jgi:DUF4097 and DUF4098 domain-containing protein YvlB
MEIDMFLRSAAILGVAALAALPAGGSAQDFNWNGSVANGRTVEIRGVNGNIKVLPSTGDRMSVTATKHSRRGDEASVTIKVIEHANGVTICTMYPTPENAKRENECVPGGGGSMSTRDNDVNVDYTVHVPSGAVLVAHTVNGDVDAQGLGGDVEATTVNGSVDVVTRGAARATTVNGSIRASMGSINADEDMRFSTVNGGIDLEVPASLNANISFSSLNGEIQTDFPVTVTSGFSKNKLSGKIGSGGRSLNMSTVNGDLTLRKRL